MSPEPMRVLSAGARRLCLAGCLLHVALVLFLVVANALDDETYGWSSTTRPGRTSLWDLEGDYTQVSYFTSIYLYLAAASAWVTWVQPRSALLRPRWLLPAAGSALMVAAVDRWYQLHEPLRDRLVLRPLGLTSPAQLPAFIWDPAMTAYTLLAVMGATIVWRGSGWHTLSRMPLVVGAVGVVVSWALDGALGARIGFNVPLVAAKDLVQMCAAFCIWLGFLVVQLAAAETNGANR